MIQIGLPLPRMREERRIALLPHDIATAIEHPGQLVIESGYGELHGFSDRDYKDLGVKVGDASDVYGLEAICQPKVTDEDVCRVDQGALFFGWVHMHPECDTTALLALNESTVIEWGEMIVDGKSVFYDNGVITGRIGVMHGMAYAGKLPNECRAAVIGRGRVGKAAYEQLEELRVPKIAVYHRGNSYLLPKYIEKYDVIVHAARAGTTILTLEDLSRMKPGAFIIHLGDDSIEGYGANSICNPVSPINGGRNGAYCVNHVPTLAYKSATQGISRAVAPYVDKLIKGEEDPVLEEATDMIRGRLRGEPDYDPKIVGRPDMHLYLDGESAQEPPEREVLLLKTKDPVRLVS